MSLNAAHLFDSALLRTRLANSDFSACRATLIGYGNMGRQYVDALKALGVRHVRVCARHEASLRDLRGREGVEVSETGVEHLDVRPAGDDLGILAVPIDLLAPAAMRLAELGFRRILVEKPVALESRRILALAEEFETRGITSACAYNRAVYPSLHEIKARAAREGGITSCTYTFTEMIKPDWPQRFSAAELARWGIANSLHVFSMAHTLIGWPACWQGHRTGAIPWHPTGAVFVGSGVSDQGIPFSYHADWGSTGRWSVEVHTPVSSYRLCPLERAFQRTTATSDWEPLEVAVFASNVKAGIVEEVAAMLGRVQDLSAMLPTLRQTAALTSFVEGVFGYAT